MAYPEHFGRGVQQAAQLACSMPEILVENKDAEPDQGRSYS
ncbi:MAG: hypothetical protein WAL32_15945 [Terriglobales bacterium]